ncbi:MAG TPA: OstA-like protein [Niabella sp.]|nr:OstA-like protein [Niabella sp.]HOZ98150.1 OstA-like protein [Niabella sp.]HQW16177.1 OstA-like protein [Niabella sp.]HQX21389.1 OstA-like protein [Niabella sp.]HQX41215.1 OstA-like protein [Niabella sp.]
MIKNSTKSGIIIFPLAIILLGCFVAYSTTTKNDYSRYLKKSSVLFRDTIKIIKSDKISLLKESDTSSITVFEGNVQLQQGKTTFRADKAIKNDNQNTFEAWGHVHIKDSDTTNIDADHLKYFGNPKIANLDGNVKLTDGTVILTAPSLEYNMNSNTGTYLKGGKIVNKKTVITSTEGVYYSDFKDVYFKKNVEVNDPAYKINSDSLQYNTGSQIATFIAQTSIVDSSKRSINTKEGFYNLRTGQAQFAKRPIINDNNKSTLIADSVYLDNNLARAAGNAVAVDSVRSTIIIANQILQNRLNEAILATEKPLLIIKQDNDSIYVRADTLFSARLTDLYDTRITHEIDTTIKYENIIEDSTMAKSDTGTAESRIGTAADSILPKTDSTFGTVPVMDSASSLKSSATDKSTNDDSTLARSVPADSSRLLQSPVAIDSASSRTVKMNSRVDNVGSSIKADSTQQKTFDNNILVFSDTIQKNNFALKPDTIPMAGKDLANKQIKVDSLQPKRNVLVSKNNKSTQKSQADSSSTIGKTTASTKDTLPVVKKPTVIKRKQPENDSANRYFEAFHNVRIYSDSMQAISDSLFYSFKDSIFRMYKEPVVWGKESQITGDTILLHTKNKKPYWMEAFKSGFMVNYITGEAFNQIKATRIDAYFKEGNLDSVRAVGSAECIYYIQDDDSAFSGINKNKCDIIDSYFENKQLKKVAFRVNVEGTIFPMRQSRPSEMKLEGFKWHEGERPKSKYELLDE